MDPVNYLLPEVMDNVWYFLPVRDLLASRLVSTKWLASLTASTVAWRYKIKGVKVITSWTEFLEENMIGKQWARAAERGFTKSKVLGSVELWTANAEAVYFATRDHRLIKADHSGRVLRTLKNLPLKCIMSGWTGLVLEPARGAIFGTDLDMNSTGEIGKGTVLGASETLVVLVDENVCGAFSAEKKVTVVTRDSRSTIVLNKIHLMTQCLALHGCAVFAIPFSPMFGRMNPDKRCMVTVFDANATLTLPPKYFSSSVPPIIHAGPKDHFCVLSNEDPSADHAHFNRVTVLKCGQLCHEETHLDFQSVVFTADYFVILTDELTKVYSLANWTLHQVLEPRALRMQLLPAVYLRLDSFKRIFYEKMYGKNWFVCRTDKKAIIYDAGRCRLLTNEIELRGKNIWFFPKWVIIDDLVRLTVKTF